MLSPFMAALFMLCLGNLAAAPYPPDGEDVLWTCKDGKQVNLKVFGDEFYARTATADGYTVIFDSDRGDYVYALPAKDGKSLAKSGTAVSVDPPRSIPPGLKEDPAKARSIREKNLELHGATTRERWNKRILATKNRRLAPRSAQSLQAAPAFGISPEISVGGHALLESAPVTGGLVALTILAQFPDDPSTPGDDSNSFPTTPSKIERFCNQTGYTDDGNSGSVKDYYSAQSNWLLTLTHVVTPIVTLPHPRNYYNYTDYPTNQSIRSGGDSGRLLVEDAVARLQTVAFDFSPLTLDTSSRILGTSVLFAGPTSGVWSQGLWPHRSFLAVPGINVGTPEEPRWVNDYQITNAQSSALPIGTFCHEIGHLLFSFPDLYDHGQDSAGLGQHCLMGSGNYNNGGFTPSPINPYLKDAVGWATVTDVDTSFQTTVALSSTGNRSYRLRKPGNPAEYFMVENRGDGDIWAASSPDRGIAIWHIDEAVSGNSNQQMTPALHYAVSLEQADGEFDLESNSNTGDSTDLFGSTTPWFNGGSLPDSSWWDGSASGFSIQVLDTPGPSMQVRFGAFTETLLHELANGSRSDWGNLDGASPGFPHIASATLTTPTGTFGDAFDAAGMVDLRLVNAAGPLLSSASFASFPVAEETATFSASFSITPSANNIDVVTGFSNGTATTWDHLAAYVRFAPYGLIHARNGEFFDYENLFNYSAGITYHFRMTVNVATRTYSAWVTPDGGAEVLIANQYAFRHTQSTVTKLDNFAYQCAQPGTHTVTKVTTFYDFPPLTSTSPPSAPLLSSDSIANVSAFRSVSPVQGKNATDDTLTVTNNSALSRVLQLAISDDYGFNSSTIVHTTSSGNAIVDASDRWFIISDQSIPETAGSKPAVMISWDFTTSLPAPTITSAPGFGNDRLTLNFGDITLPAGAGVFVTIRRELFETVQLAIASGNPISYSTIVTNTLDDGYGSLRDTLRHASPGSTITFSPPLSGQTISLTSGEIVFNADQTVDASDLPLGITINCNNFSRHFNIPEGRTVALEGLKLLNGNVTTLGPEFRVGGGILNSGTLSMIDCTVAQCTAERGGAICNQGSLNLTGCTISGCRMVGSSNSMRGGGIMNYNTIAMVDCLITGSGKFGTEGLGGGIFNSGAATLTRCVLQGNQAGNGGGFHNSNTGHATLDSCTIKNNSIVYSGGGGISNSGNLSLYSCSLSGNDALDGSGGAILSNGNTYLENTTVANNYNGYSPGAAGISGAVTLRHSTVVGNSHIDSIPPPYFQWAGVGVRGSIITLENSIIGDNLYYNSYGPTVTCDFTGNINTNIGVSLISTLNGRSSFPGIVAPPLLAPRGDYSGYTHSCPPLAGSPAIDAAPVSSIATDQRGLPRPTGIVADIGSVETQQVTSLADAGPGSLRQFVADTYANAPVAFSPALDGQTIELTSGPVILNKNLGITATSLDSGITISGGGTQRIFEIAGSTSVSLTGVHLTRARSSTSGAAIQNHGTLTLNGSTISKCLSFLSGGAIWNDLSANLNLINSTISGNLAADSGGGIANDGALTLTHSTITDNDSFFGTGGGVESTGTATLANSIVGGNLSFTGLDLAGNATQPGPNLTSGNPRLAPLAYYGGKIPIHPLLPNSPAFEGGLTMVGSPATDQRGASRPSGPMPDLGAVEAFALGGPFLASIDGDSIPDILEGPNGPYPHLAASQNDSLSDADGDGQSDADEIANMTDPLDGTDYFAISVSSIMPAAPPLETVLRLKVRTFPGLTYEIHDSPDLLAPFTKLPGSTFIAHDHETEIEIDTLGPRRFFRGVRVE